MRVVGVVLMLGCTGGLGAWYALFVVRQQRRRQRLIREIHAAHEEQVADLESQVRYWADRPVIAPDDHDRTDGHM